MLCHLGVLIVLIPLVHSQTPFFYAGSGNFTNSCPHTVCSLCGVGLFKQSCSGTNPGGCAGCSGLPANADWITDGGFTDSCKFNCKPAYTLVDSTCVAKGDSVYVVSVAVSVPLAAVDVTSQLDKLVATFALLSSCGVCGSFSANPVQCERCRISLVIQQTSARRLLTPTSTVGAIIEQLGGSVQAATTNALLTTANINVEFSINSLSSPAVVVVNAATQVLPAPTTPGNPSQTTTGIQGGAVTTPRPLTTAVTVTAPRPSTTTAAKSSTLPATTPLPVTSQPSDTVTERRGLQGTPAPTSQDSGPNMAVIGGAIGGVVAFLVVVAVIACCAIMKRGPIVAQAAPPATQTVVARFNPRHHRAPSTMHAEAPAGFQMPPNAILVMGPMYRPPLHTYPH